MQKLLCLAVALVGATASIPSRVEAASLWLETPAVVAPGWTRIAGRYESGDAEPSFRAVARCGAAGDEQVLEGRAYLAPAEGAVWLDLPGDPSRLVPSTMSCEAPEVAMEMLVGSTVVARAPIAKPDVVAAVQPAYVGPPPPPAASTRRFSLKGQKYGVPGSKRTEAGVEWALDSRVSIQLNYERTSQPPMMAYDHDDGILTRLRIGF